VLRFPTEGVQHDSRRCLTVFDARAGCTRRHRGPNKQMRRESVHVRAFDGCKIQLAEWKMLSRTNIVVVAADWLGTPPYSSG